MLALKKITGGGIRPCEYTLYNTLTLTIKTIDLNKFVH